ncbi:MAG TPA: porin [Usitatibacteraceae bacterium]
MNTKKMLAVLVAGACGAPILASAQDAPVVMYGRLYPQFTVISSGGATAATGPRNTLSGAPSGVELVRHNEVQASNSRLGFRGKESLGGGYEAFFQIESTIPVDAGGGNFGTRDTFVGVRGGFGSVKLGNMDTVYKTYGDQLSFLGVSSGNFVSNSNVLSKGGFGTSSSSSFHLRRANTAQYDSPVLGGFEFAVGYSPDEAKTTNRNADLVSTGVKYGGGKGSPFFVAAAYEIHHDLFGGSNNAPAALSNAANLNARSKDTALRLTGSYTFFEKTTVEVNYAIMEYKETGGLVGRFNNYKHNAFSVSLEHNLGPWQFAASLVQAAKGSCSLVGGAVCTTDGLKGTMMAVGSRYNFSKRSSIFAMYDKVFNGFAARYNPLASGNPSNGSDVTQFAIGIQHAF